MGRGWPAEGRLRRGEKYAMKKRKKWFIPIGGREADCERTGMRNRIGQRREGTRLGEVDPLSRINRLKLLPLVTSKEKLLTLAEHVAPAAADKRFAAVVSCPGLCASSYSPHVVRTVATLAARADRELLMTCPDSTLSLGG